MRLRKPERKYKPLLNKKHTFSQPNKNPENKIPSKRKSKIFFFFHVFTMKKKNPFFNQFSGLKDLRGEKIRLRQWVTRKNKFLLKKNKFSRQNKNPEKKNKKKNQKKRRKSGEKKYPEQNSLKETKFQKSSQEKKKKQKKEKKNPLKIFKNILKKR